MSLILTTPAALEEYSNRTDAAIAYHEQSIKEKTKSLMEEDEPLYFNYTLDELTELHADMTRLLDLRTEFRVALRNPKLGIHVMIEPLLLDLLVDSISI